MSLYKPSRTGLAHRAFLLFARAARDCAVILILPDGSIARWEESASRMHGWTRGEAEGQHLRLIYPGGAGAEMEREGEEGGEAAAAADLDAAMGEGEQAIEGWRLRADGSTFWAGVTLTPLRDEDGTLLGFVHLTRDLTARREAQVDLEAELDAALAHRTAAEEANRAKSEFLTMMSHEIRTPLNGMLGYLDLLEMEVGGPITEDQGAYIRRARESGRHLIGLIEEILDLALIEVGHLDVQRATLPLEEAVAQALSVIAPQARRKRVRLVNAVAEATETLTYLGQEKRVRQILVNLLSNAVKFTEPDGSVTISAGSSDRAPERCEVREEGPWVYVRIEDTGEGIEPDRLEVIFEPFVQADPDQRSRRRGAGLGLTISRRLARLMGGDIVARSSLGTGSTFLLWLPSGPASAQEAGAEQARRTRERPDAFSSLRDAGTAILLELERILSSFVRRLQQDPVITSARTLDEATLENHMATFLADLAQSLVTRDPAAAPELDDDEVSTEIQTRIAVHHGRQRARHGWSEEELRREHELLQAELESAVRRRASPADPSAAGEARAALREFLTRAQAVGLQALRDEEKRLGAEEDRPSVAG